MIRYYKLSFLQVRAELFDTLSENSNIDHPLCDECTDSLLELMDQELKITETECNEYNEYLKKSVQKLIHYFYI